MKRRITSLRTYLKQHKVQAFLVTNLINVKYLSGFSGSLGFVLILPEAVLFFTDARYTQRAEKEIPSFFTFVEIKQSLSEVLPVYLKKYKVKKLGVEGASLSYTQFLSLKKSVRPANLIPLEGAVEELRIIKDERELNRLKKAIRLNDSVFFYIHRLFTKNAGRPLRADYISLKAECFIKEKKAEGFAFNPIVAFGKDTACPHAKLSTRPLRTGDIMLVDIGAKADGYHSDLTRVYFKQNYKGKLRDIYQIVLEAQSRAIAAIKPGVEAASIDSIARDYISRLGYGDYFSHSLGHGIGLEVHERPRISSKSKESIKEGMVFSVEPGIYLPGVGGVRIEDLVVVTARGCQVLSRSPK